MKKSPFISIFNFNLVLLILLVFIIQQSKSTLHESELMLEKLDALEIIQKIHDTNRRAHSIVGFSDHTFGISYAGRDGNVHVAFIKYGVLTGQMDITVKVTGYDTSDNVSVQPNPQEVSSCAYDDDKLLVIYQQSYKQYYQIISKNSGIIKGETKVSDVDVQLCNCHQSPGTDNFIFTYITVDGTDSSYNTNYEFYNVMTETMIVADTIIQDGAGDQLLPKVTKLIGANEFIVSYKDTGSGNVWKQKINSITGAIIGIPKRSEGSDSNNGYPNIMATEDGGYIHFFSNSASKFTEIYKYKSSQYVSCFFNTSTNDIYNRPGITIYKDMVFFIYTNVLDNKVYAKQFRHTDCTMVYENVIYETRTLGGDQWEISPNNNLEMALSLGNSDSDLIGVTFVIQKVGDTKFKQLVYQEYFLEQKSVCAQYGCAGCYNNQTCPLCSGSNLLFRLARKDSNGECKCSEGYIDEFSWPDKQDCIACSIYCETCSSSPDQCNICIPGLRQDAPECKHPHVDEQCGTFITIKSVGYNSLNYRFYDTLSFNLNNQDITVSQKPGLHFAVLNQNGQIIKSYVLNSNNLDNQAYIKTWVDSLATGTNVLVGVNKSAPTLNSDIYDALQQLGLNPATTIGQNEPFAMIGRKGALNTDLKVYQGKGLSTDSNLIVEGCAVDCDYKCDTCSIQGINNKIKSDCYLTKFDDTYLSTCTENQCQAFPTVEAAIEECDKTADCSGVTEDGVNIFETRKFNVLGASSRGENSMQKDDCNHSYQNVFSMECDTCANTRENPPLCTCIIGYYESGISECFKCDRQCGSCVTSSSNCLSCSDDKRINFPSCECKIGYFDDGVNFECQKCNHSCIECVGQETNCTSCSDNITRDINTQCTCKNGYVDKGEIICSKCSIFCKTCSQEISNCQACLQGQNRQNIPPQCQCLPGYFAIEGVLDCFKCPSNCKECSSYNQCTICEDNDLLEPNCTSQKKGSTVIIENGVHVDKICDKKCETCQNQVDNCLKCQGDNRVSNSEPDCQCIQGFHDYEGKTMDCEQIDCIFGCNQCNSGDSCTQCQEGFELNSQSKQCECTSGYELIGTDCYKMCGKMEYLDGYNQCLKCKYYQNICLAKCPKDTQLNASRQICEDIVSHTKTIIIVVGIVFITLLSAGILIYCLNQKSKNKPHNFINLQNNPQEI